MRNGRKGAQIKLTNFNLNDYHTLIFDFDGIFTDNKVYLSQSGEEIIRCDKADSLGFNLFNAFIRKYSLKINYFVLSKEKNEVIKLRLNKLRIKCFQGIDNKLDFIKNYLMKEYFEVDISKRGIIYIGNDLNDLESILFSGYTFCPIDSHKIIRDNVNQVIEIEGGNGFIRKCLEEIMNFDKFTTQEICELLKY